MLLYLALYCQDYFHESLLYIKILCQKYIASMNTYFTTLPNIFACIFRKTNDAKRVLHRNKPASIKNEAAV
jgi:hypothetical protein